MPRNLNEQVIVITGASSGIGAATAIACADAGMHTVLAARRKDRLITLANRINKLGRRALPVSCNVDHDHDVAQLIDQTMQEFGRLDVLFANAGYGLISRVLDTTDQQMRAIFETNYFGTLRAIHAAVPAMQQTIKDTGHHKHPRKHHRKHILICSSVVSEIGLPMNGAYCATKAAQDSIAGALRAELYRQGIDVSSVHPIGTRTEFMDHAIKATDPDATTANTPASLIQTSEHVAKAIVRCLRRPRPEVWPHIPSRFGVALATALPRLSAWAIRRKMR